VTATVAITPPALEAIQFTATPPTDEACDAQSGQLTFSVAASPAMSKAQYSGAVLVVTSKATGDAVQNCTSTPSAAGFEVACTGLADGKYKLAVTVPNTQYPGAFWRGLLAVFDNVGGCMGKGLGAFSVASLSALYNTHCCCTPRQPAPPGCPHTTTVAGTVTLIPTASLAAAGDALDLTADQCTE
jgi:hypothetical protein